MATRRDALLGGKYPALEPRLHDLGTRRMQIARKTLAGPGAEGLRSHLQGLTEWNGQRERLEADLAREIPEMNLEQKLRAADRRAVALNVPEGVALVEFIRFPVFDFQAAARPRGVAMEPACYVAFVQSGGAPDDVQMIDPSAAEPIDQLIAYLWAGTDVAAAETRVRPRHAKTARRSTAGR